jgi:hypothetical protein
MSKSPRTAENSTEAVGYGKPPKETQFRPGKSGNPNGRPKGARNIDTLMAEELAAPVKIREQGVDQTVSKAHAIVKKVLASAMNGDMRASSAVLAWYAQKAARNPESDEELAAEDIEILEALQKRKASPK